MVKTRHSSTVRRSIASSCQGTHRFLATTRIVANERLHVVKLRIDGDAWKNPKIIQPQEASSWHD
jgi:hypothetical protein